MRNKSIDLRKIFARNTFEDHEGRPGKVGGSLPKGSSKGKKSSKDSKEPAITKELIKAEMDNLKGLEMGYDSARLEYVEVSKLVQVEEGEIEGYYAEDYKKGKVLPPIAVVKVGNTYEIMDGNKRYDSAKKAGIDKLPALVMEGFDLFKETQPYPENM